ncbi:solute carrier family 44 protein member 2 [Tieghemostelium lacteum]|uniref:Choline transporter-like protein n=1 Tax=Tieghemostelium lacteum TaxID=361077 RepID=A0A151ZCI3_TIELA|nr:solute carrier family 44 protein member 2 [Tieghemostelium lacteum]|eukprot:KYQ91635.1 solute carrier family 44 protein member 2 [Tieghemostelium lacteum]
MGAYKDEDHAETANEVIAAKGVYLKRKCQDCFFLLLFLAFWVGMIVIAGIAGKEGNPQRLVAGTDSYGNICGTDNIADGVLLHNQSRDLSNAKNVYFIYYTTYAVYRVICVEACPDVTVDVPVNASDLICDYDTVPSLDQIYPNGTCWPKYAASPVLNRCLPTALSNTSETVADKVFQIINDRFSKDTTVKILSDLVRSWKYLIIGAAIALGIGLFWIFLMRFFAGVITWTTILCALAFMALLTAQVYFQWQKAQDAIDTIPPQQRLEMQYDNVKALKVIFIILCVLSGLFLLIVVAMLKRIKLAIRIIKESSRAIGTMPSIFFFPIFIFFWLCVFIIYWVVVGFYLGTAGEPTYSYNAEYDVYTFTGYEANKKIRYCQIYHFFGLLWTLAFILAVNQTTIAGAISSWYWVRDKKDTPYFPVWSSFGRVLRYHLGSLAFGSLILAIIQFIRWVLRYLEKKFKGKEENFAVFIVKCLNCIFGCFERFIKFLDKNAYIMISIYGYSFCEGAQRGFTLILSNILRVGAVNMIGTFLMFLGRILITAATVGISFYLLERVDDLTFYVIPVILIGFIAFFIASGIMSVYDMSIDTILLCFCEDCARNDGSDSRPYYMSKSLRKFVDGKERTKCC